MVLGDKSDDDMGSFGIVGGYNLSSSVAPCPSSQPHPLVVALGGVDVAGFGGGFVGVVARGTAAHARPVGGGALSFEWFFLSHFGETRGWGAPDIVTTLGTHTPDPGGTEPSTPVFSLGNLCAQQN
jgi:hypothetical protein